MLGVLLRQEVKFKGNDGATHNARPQDDVGVSSSRGRNSRLSYWCCLLTVVMATALLRAWQIGSPPISAWDEMHFIKFSQNYLNGTFFFDVHPPLGKMLVAGIGFLAGQNVSSPVSQSIPYQHPRDDWYILMRLGLAGFGVLQMVLSFLTVHQMSRSLSAAYITALLIICDCAANSLNRLVLLDPILVTFILLSFYCSVKFSAQQHRPFGLTWWCWMVATGVSLGLTMSVKYVGMFVTATVGLHTISQLWSLYCDTSHSLLDVVKHTLTRSIGFILVPIFIYISTFYVHFHLLSKGANLPGVGMHSAQFRLSFPDFANLTRPAEVTYGAHVTLKPRQLPTGFLSTSFDLYPADVGAEHQVVALEPHLDELNAWGFKRPEDGGFNSFDSADYTASPVRHGDLVRMVNIYTERHLHTHRILAPVTPKQYQVTGFGEHGEYHPGGVWRVLLASDEADEGVTVLEAVGTEFRLVNNRTGCVLRAGTSALPAWGYYLWEVVCDPRGVLKNDPGQLWQIDDNLNPKIPSGELKQRHQLSMLERILQLHHLMFKQNNQMKTSEFEGEGGLQKMLTTEPWMWPILYRGCPGYGSGLYSMYFIGSPQVYLLNFIVLCLLPLLAVRWRRQRAQHEDTGRVQEGAVGYLLLAWAMHYLPFWCMHRILYFHHYLPAFYFSTMISGILMDSFIGWLEKSLPSLPHNVVRMSSVLTLTAIYAHSYWCNWELAYGVPGDGSDEIHIRKYLLYDTWLM